MKRSLHKKQTLFLYNSNKKIKSGRFEKQLELKKFKLFFLCILHKKEGEERI